MESLIPMESLDQSLRRREEWRRKAQSSPVEKRAELYRCQGSIEHWCNHWCYTFDPRRTPSILPFDLFPKQAEFLRWVRDRELGQEDGLVEKSRDMGVTWLCCLHALHGWRFRRSYAVGFGSRKLDLVDRKGDPDCIFEKIRFLIDWLPRWMLPRRFTRAKHSGYCKILNPANGASITGEGGDGIGRGGRKAVYFVDEAAFLEHPQLVERSLSETTRCRIDVSTPNGPGNPFAVKRHSGTVSVFTLHWRSDPRKDEAWYAEKKRTKDAVTIAQELDIDYSASVEGITIPAKWVRAAVNLKLPRGAFVVGGADIAEMGRDRTVLMPRRGPVVLDPIDWGQVNTTETAWRLADESTKLDVQILNYDVCGIGTNIRGTWQSSTRVLTFTPVAVNSGEAPSRAFWPDGRTSKELFVNLRAEMWWTLRARFERTYEFVELSVKHPPEDLISIPDHPQLIAELSLPLHRRMDNGKIKIESKEDMRQRGVKSPDFADALCLSFAPDEGPPVSIRPLNVRPDAGPPATPEGPPRKLLKWIAATQSWQPRPEWQGETIYLPDSKSESESAYALCVFYRLLDQPEPDAPDLPEETRKQVESRVKEAMQKRKLIP